MAEKPTEKPGCEPPLSDLRVLDFSQIVAGPLAGLLLGDLGADVIKVEPPEGDAARRIGTTRVNGSTESEGVISLNRNKRSVVLDLKSEAGRAAAFELAKTADIIIENFRPGAMEKLGLGYEAVSAANPGVIYCSICGFGRTGPWSGRPAVDQIIQAASGIMQLTGAEDSGPLRTGFPFADTITPALATVGVLSALRERDRTGKGQRVDVSMLDAVLMGIVPREGYYFATGGTPARLGNAHYQVAPCGSFKTSDDRYIQIIAHQPKFWTSLVAALGEPSLAGDPRYVDNATRFANRETLHARMTELLAERPLAEWLERLESAGALFAPVRNFDEVFGDPDVAAHMVVEMEHAAAGRVKTVANPIQLSESPVRYERPPPALGEHSGEILDTQGGVRADAWRARATD